MHIAVIGGTRHVGFAVVELLVDAGHKVSVYNRGRTRAELPTGVRQVVVDRMVRGQVGSALRSDRPDAVVDIGRLGFADPEADYVLARTDNIKEIADAGTGNVANGFSDTAMERL